MTIANTEQISDRQAFGEYELPEGWDILPLGHCVDILDNLRIPVNSEERKTRHGSIPYYGATGQVGWIDDFLFDEELLLLGEDGAPFLEKPKTVAYIIEGKSWVNNHAHVLRAIQGLTTNKFLKYYLNKFDFSDFVTGSTRLKLTQGAMKKIPVIVPPLAEQSRIVAKMEELLASVNATKERLSKVLLILRRFRQSVLAAVCSGRLTADWRSTQKELEPADQLVKRIREKYQDQYLIECIKAKQEDKRLPKKAEILEPREVETTELPEIPDEWTWIHLPVLGYMSRGKSKHRPRNAPHLYGGPYPFIQTGDIAQSRGLITSHQQTYSEAGLAQSHLWPSGTICITIAANIANSALLTYPACFPDSVVGLIPDESLCLKEYAEFFIRIARANLDQYAPATAQKNINIEILSDVAVPLPPIAEQEVIVRRVEAMFKLADAIEKRVAAASERTEKLTQAILAKAFRGELVPTEAELARREGRSYEPASELLARIKSERESRGASKTALRSPNKMINP